MFKLWVKVFAFLRRKRDNLGGREKKSLARKITDYAREVHEGGGCLREDSDKRRKVTKSYGVRHPLEPAVKNVRKKSGGKGGEEI